MARISACAVGSESAMGALEPRPAISPPATTTAPTGTFPAWALWRASTRAWRIKYSSVVVMRTSIIRKSTYGRTRNPPRTRTRRRPAGAKGRSNGLHSCGIAGGSDHCQPPHAHGGDHSQIQLQRPVGVLPGHAGQAAYHGDGRNHGATVGCEGRSRRKDAGRI